jgi:pimeloyl-ACP methyl ester carboxylesterase
MEQNSRIEVAVQSYIAETFLDGDSEGLDSSSPLLEWGILDSMGMARLLKFLEQQFSVKIDEDAITPKNFRDVRSISSLVVAYSTRPPPPAPSPGDAVDPEVAALVEYGAQRLRVALDAGEVHGILMPGPAPRWVLLPEPGRPATDYGELQRRLEGFHESLALDLAGYGASRCLNPEPTYWDQLGFISEVLLRPDNAHVVLVAHGASALIATEYARRHPDRVIALVVVGYGAFDDPEPRAEGSALAQFFDPDACQLARSMYEGLAVPTLFVCGQDDAAVPATAVLAAAERAEASQVKWLARTGHALPRERPDELMSLIETYLRAHELNGGTR